MQKYKLFYSYPNLFELFFQLFQYKYNNMLITRLLSNNQQPILKIYLSRFFLEIKDFIENERIKCPLIK